MPFDDLHFKTVSDRWNERQIGLALRNRSHSFRPRIHGGLNGNEMKKLFAGVDAVAGQMVGDDPIFRLTLFVPLDKNDAPVMSNRSINFVAGCITVAFGIAARKEITCRRAEPRIQ